jgi:hypothetical protein
LVVFIDCGGVAVWFFVLGVVWRCGFHRYHD